RFTSDLAKQASYKKSLFPELACSYEKELVTKLSALTDSIAEKTDDLEGAVFEREQLTSEMEYEEYVMTSLRTCWGCDLEMVRLKWGVETVSHIRNQLLRYPEQFYKLTYKRLVLTEEGLLFADGVASDLFL
ncbi:MAG: hypothetical protein II525_08030, partial [Bacteroidales bacterium]|nr:hypothetical protein [Bacteroidales bacterium]